MRHARSTEGGPAANTARPQHTRHGGSTHDDGSTHDGCSTHGSSKKKITAHKVKHNGQGEASTFLGELTRAAYRSRAAETIVESELYSGPAPT